MGLSSRQLGKGELVGAGALFADVLCVIRAIQPSLSSSVGLV